jgi:hypothetical protein
VLKTGGFPTLLDLKIAENDVFYLKVLDKIYFQDVFLRNRGILKFYVTKAMWSYTCPKFWELYIQSARGASDLGSISLPSYVSEDVTHKETLS